MQLWVRLEHWNEVELREAVEELVRRLDLGPRDYDIESGNTLREELETEREYADMMRKENASLERELAELRKAAK